MVFMLTAEEVAPARAVRRKSPKREIRVSAVATAAAVIGDLEEGVEISGLTNGQFSLIDVIEHLLGQTGPADVCLSTWTMGVYDETQARAFCADKRITRMRFIVDPSMFTRRPELSGRLVDAFGVDAFRAVNTHSKFATIRGEKFACVIRTSMNLNTNKRMENFDIAVDSDFCAFYEGVVNNIFEKFDCPKDGVKTQSEIVFSTILDAFTNVVEAQAKPIDKAEQARIDAELRRQNWAKKLGAA